MGDVFYVILIIWVLWRIFGRSSVKTHVIHHHQYRQSDTREGEVRISKTNTETKTKPNDDGEYVEFEEIK